MSQKKKEEDNITQYKKIYTENERINGKKSK